MVNSVASAIGRRNAIVWLTIGSLYTRPARSKTQEKVTKWQNLLRIAPFAAAQMIWP